ncbi:hypothetical protein [Agromyces seonyuensis]|uniref:Uncharacterized protein n=1 Tax=Agromyces seonyuensis TaxID=2662446 RepID=A0A6I4P668_9MICO|nr:hypothetical protein [Agromyces seonyuensis]MWB99064.1 hypothetical protein [Agromyces seonyuensis]
MSGQQAETPQQKRWSDERAGHWHGARPTQATSDRQPTLEVADDAPSAEPDADADDPARAKSAVHEGNVRRWEAATHRTWNRAHGNGGPV